MTPVRRTLVVCAVVSSLLVACSGAESPSPLRGPAAAVAPGTVSVYDDALAAGWENWSWATVDWASTATVASGTRAIAVTYGPFTGLYFHRATASLAGMSALSLSVNGGATAGAHLSLAAVLGGTTLGSVDLGTTCAAKAIPQNAWTRCTIPLSALGAATTTPDGFWLQEADGVARPVMYVDEVAFVPAAPAAPTGVTATASSASVAVSWGAVAGATSYDVLRSTSSGGTFTKVNAAPLTTASYTDAAVTAGATYWYEITATNAGGTGAASAAVSATVPAAPPPPAAGGVTVYADALAAGWENWSWATVDWASTATVASGARAIAVTYGPFTGLYFHRATASIAGMTALTLSVNGGTTAGAHLVLTAVAGSTQLGHVDLGTYCAAKAIPQSAWTKCTVPLTALGAGTTTLDGFWIQEGDGVARPVMYVDDVAFTGSSTTPPPATVTVALSPASGAADACGGQLSFASTVTGTTNTAVTWAVQEGAAGGTVSASGTYTAPAAPGTYHVVATSAADPNAKATAAVTVADRVLSVTVAPATLTLAPGATGQFTATVTTRCGSTTSAQAVTAPL